MLNFRLLFEDMMRNIYLLTLAILTGFTSIQAQSIAISEFNYNSDTYNNSGDWVELHNYGASAVNLGGWKVKNELGNTYTIPGGISLAPDAYLVVVEWIDTFLMVHPDVSNYIGSTAFSLDNMSGSVLLYDGGGALVRQINYVDSVPWPRAADGYGPTVQILDEAGDENDPENWIAGCVLGTPGSAYADCNYDIIISEINYNSLLGYNPGDWVEIYNRGASSVSLSGWILRDSRNNNAYLIPGGTSLAAGSRLVVSDSLESFTVIFPGVTNVIGEPTFHFSNSGDAVRLYSSDNTIQYTVRFNDKSPWPTDADGNGFTLENVNEGGNPNITESWVAGCLFGSPGNPFVLPCPNSIQTYDPQNIQVGPNPFTEMTHVSLLDATGISEIRIYDLQGTLIQYAQPMNSYYTWNGTNQQNLAVPSGMYVMHIITQGGANAIVQVIKAG